MQNSRLANIGYKSLKTRSNMPLLQQISLQQFSEEQPIRNTSTLYLDENGRQRQLSQINSPTLNNKSSLLRKKSSRNQAELADAETNDKDMYALPIVNQRSDRTRDTGLANLRDRALEESKRSKMVSSQYVTDRKQRKTHMDVVKQLDQSGHRSLLSIKRPKGFTRRPKMQQIDFIGGNLYEVEDIISDISKIIDRSSRKNMVITHKQEKHPLKTNKWLNNNFGGLSKLDEMLLNYKSIPDNEPSIPISQAFYRDSTYAKRDVSTPANKANKGPQIKSKFDNNSEFMGKGKIQKQQKFSMVVIKWNQMPIIGCKWDQSLFLKLQSFPQQDEYRKVVLKAYDQKIKSYSIFFNTDAGLKQPKKSSSNDKNKGQPTLMSQQQYVNHWQANLPQCSLNQQQKQLLMQFDVQWYRTLIELCYHSGLEDLLQKNYDINGYVDVLARIQRLDDISSALVINNQMLYLRAYFQQVYPYSLYETLLGLIRVKNDDGMPVKDVHANFVQLIGQDAADQFCAWPIKQDQSQLLLILQLCGQRSAPHIQFTQDQSLVINMQNPTAKQPYSYTLNLTNSIAQNKKKDDGNQEQKQQNYNRIMFKPDEQNDWQLFIKMENDIVNSIKYELKTVEELLFGVVYGLELSAT